MWGNVGKEIKETRRHIGEMHTPGKVGSVSAHLRLVLLHEPETLERLAMGHRLVRAALIAWMIIRQRACIATGPPELGGSGSVIAARGPTCKTRVKGSSATIQHDQHSSLASSHMVCAMAANISRRATTSVRLRLNVSLLWRLATKTVKSTSVNGSEPRS